MYKNEIDPKCLLCAKEEENIEHFILNYKSLSKVRNTILQELIITFSTLGIEFHVLSANEKLQDILDVCYILDWHGQSAWEILQELSIFVYILISYA